MQFVICLKYNWSWSGLVSFLRASPSRGPANISLFMIFLFCIYKFLFKGAYRKVQANMKLDISIGSNCRLFDLELPENMFYSNIYSISSKRPKRELNESIYEEQKELILNELEKNANEKLNACENDDNIDVMANTHYILDTTPNFMVAYIASSIERKIMETNTFHCTDCVSVLQENEKQDNINTKLFHWNPCISTINICKASEQFFKLYDVQSSRFDFKVLYCLIFRTMNLDSLFPASKFECGQNHRYQFVKCIVGQYISIRANQVAKQITLESHTKLLRQRLNQLTNMQGQ